MSDHSVGIAVALHRVARRDPGAPFLLWRGETLTYEDADRRVRALAATLRRLDAEGGGTGRVVIFAENSPAAVLVWLAAQAGGLVPVTLNRGQRGRVLVDVVERSRPSVLFADADGAPILREALDGGTRAGAVLVHSDDLREPVSQGLGEPAVTLEAPAAAAAGDVATIMFSSGTTGVSKGVVIPHGMFEASSQRLQEAWAITSEDVFHCWAPWFHVAAQVDVFAVAVRAGASIALFEGFSASRFWQQVHDSRATVFGGFVSVLEMLYGRPESPLDRSHRLRMGVAGHVPRTLRRNFEHRFGVPMLDAYGMSEAEPLTMPTVEAGIPDGSCGPPSADFELQVQDDDGRPCPPGQEGQIVFRPRRENVMMLGYLDDPDRTADAWRDGWFLTGDLGVMDADGLLYYRDRMAEFIRIRGENVSPQEVESVLVEHPGVAEAGVVGIPSDVGEHEIKAVIVRSPGASIDDLPGWCEQRMAKFMVPSRFQFVDALPRTPTSKIRRPELRSVDAPVHTAVNLPD